MIITCQPSPGDCLQPGSSVRVVVPDLFAKVVIIDAGNAVVAELGDNGPDSWKALRTGPRDAFPSGKFVCPHGAAFDRHGNIFVVEWVEVGRVTKLRKV